MTMSPGIINISVSSGFNRDNVMVFFLERGTK